MKTPYFGRYVFLGVLFAVAGLAIVIQMARIQDSKVAGELRAQGERYSGEMHKIYPERGSIYDRWGHLLAGNEQVYEVGVDLQLVSNPGTIAATLNRVIGSDYAQTLATASIPYVEGKAQFAILDDFITGDKIDELNRLKKQYVKDAANVKKGVEPPSLDGLVFTSHLKRSYPEGMLASNVLGFYSYLDREKGRGYFGVEEKYNDLMAGQPQQVWLPYDPNLVQKLPDVAPGSSLILTIDREIQASTEGILDKAIKDTGADAGAIVVMDPKNGELLAMATTPRLDPNQYWKYADVFPNATPFNRVVSQTYEPGSVFKVLTMATGLDTGTVNPETSFLDTGVYSIGGGYVYNWDGGAWGQQNMTGCMEHSLNVCLAWLADQIGPTNFYKYIQNFGIGHLTGIDLSGEATFPLRLPGDGQWFPVDLGTNSFGQGLAVTPIQMVMAISAVANGEGKMVAPHILRAMVDNGRQYNTNSQVVGQPISAQTAKTETEMLAISLEKESSDALVPGYRVAGKTGTAEIPTPTGYSSDLTNASFVGWGPVDDPRFLVYVWLEKPRTSKWGSVVASPVFSSVVQSLVVQMNIPPDDQRRLLAAR
ncbi:MAG: penicillin-binding protein 2 [Anaerolineaceae bacterium]|nr:penicillin-binding protein 2 [Anaerolineaceae bacterium]